MPLSTSTADDRVERAVRELADALREEPKPATAPELLTVAEAIARLRISRGTFYKLLTDGELRSIHVNRRRLVPATAIADYIRSREA